MCSRIRVESFSTHTTTVFPVHSHMVSRTIQPRATRLPVRGCEILRLPAKDDQTVGGWIFPSLPHMHVRGAALGVGRASATTAAIAKILAAGDARRARSAA